MLSNDGALLFVATHSALLVVERNPGSGELTRTPFEATISAPGGRPSPLAITHDDAYLFVFDQDGQQANLFSLEDPLTPERLATLYEYYQPEQLNACRFADSLTGSVAVNVYCPGLAFAARWDPEAESLERTDWIARQQADRYNGPLMPLFDAPAGYAASPDDRHVYLSTRSHGIVIIGRGAPPGGDAHGPDLVVGSPSVDDPAPASGATFTLNATVRNRGNAESAATTLRFYRSADASISSGDMEVGSIDVPGIAASGVRDRSIQLTAPSDPGTYHYGACVEGVDGETDAGNNCSTAVPVTVADSVDSGTPDLVVESASVDDAGPDAGGSFTFSAAVRNSGDGRSDATTLRYYRSTNSTISSGDTGVGTDSVRSLAAGADSNESIELTAPSSAGTYYYGACVDSVSGESSTGNNCSNGVEVEIADGGGGSDSYCRDDQTVEPGDRCDIFDTSFWFEVQSSGRGCLRAGGINICGGNSIRQNGSLNGVRVTLLADRNNDDSWTIDDVEPAPGDEGGGAADDHGNSFTTATSVSVPSTTAGELEEGGDHDFFRVDVGEATTLTVETAGNTDTYGTLFDASETSVEENDDGGSGLNFRIVGEVEAGTYYVQVRGFSSSTKGRYDLDLSQDSGGGGESFGAISYDFSVSDDCPGLAAGVAVNRASEPDASSAARAACRADGGSASECREDTTVFDGCAAMAYGSLPGTSCSVYVVSNNRHAVLRRSEHVQRSARLASLARVGCRRTRPH